MSKHVGYPEVGSARLRARDFIQYRLRRTIGPLLEDIRSAAPSETPEFAPSRAHIRADVT